MLPTVTHLTSIDSYRDGGSVGISFDGEKKYWYQLFFPVKCLQKSDERDRTIDFKVGYLQPVLEINIPVEWTSKITGITNINYTATKQRISWEEAVKLLELMKDLVEGFEMEGEMSEYYDREEGLSIYREMWDAANNQGVISN